VQPEALPFAAMIKISTLFQDFTIKAAKKNGGQHGRHSEIRS